MTAERLLSPTDAAEVLCLSRAGLWKAVAAKRLPQPYYPLPKAPRWLLTDLLAAVAATRAVPAEQALARVRNASAKASKGKAA